MWFATLLSTLLTLPPTWPMAVMAATEISEAISTYSMAVAPCSFFINLRKMDNMEFSPNQLTGGTPVFSEAPRYLEWRILDNRRRPLWPEARLPNYE